MTFICFPGGALFILQQREKNTSGGSTRLPKNKPQYSVCLPPRPDTCTAATVLLYSIIFKGTPR
ncbi:hypothetical protein DPMN_145668 [Dreissena polymorpha]|uniref:Uncharacterized protein n=1 Tax=Dreissena polymorpha TaxID=45954 RepID=A0A9D4F5K9_DREPO|nr:hypothetical protein DPMN_145668 [Dreissena polymorpha]